ncbi:tape measure protein [Lactococcus cremoris]|uniref:Tape measure domain protein n=3 Tax=Lactococcus lactis subsp. cremoris TaxID=1359 RepID=A0ABR5EDK2_LACLC|nr:tape measure protein [Lactococcus cremoris]KKW70096.1 tape measure domain protein [Lactococcus cremoris]TNU81781.1 tape measure protein [Lactococcus cremoris]
MSDSYSLAATLSAKDQGFTSTLKAGIGALDSLTAKAEKSGSVFKSVLGANVIGSGITKGLSLVSTGVRSLVSDLDESSKAWQVFQGNMEQLKMPTKDIQAAKKDMQQFAVQTIYSASDMASTYSQLAAVGIKNTGQLVKGFGGLAAASAEPTQAMKTLSQQATQMAAKPMVQWQDFKLMLEQTPAGVAAVAKTMGMSTKDMVKNVQDGKIATQDFFDAVSKTGTNANFTKMATQFKTVGQAIDGLKEGLSNKLQPIFDKVSQKGIAFVTNLSDAINKIDFEKIANKAMAFVGKIGKGFSQIWSGFKDSGAIASLSTAFSAIGAAINNIKAALSGGTGEGLKNLGTSLGGITSKAAGIIEAVANAIAKMSPGQINQVVGALKAAATAMLAFKAGSIAFQKGLAVYNGAAKAVTAIKSLTTALKGLSAVKGGKGASAVADIPTAPATSKLSGWAGIAKSMGVIIAIGASMKLVASAFKDMSTVRVSWGQLGKNLAQMGVFLLAAGVSMGVIGGAIQLFPPIAAALAIGAGVFVGLAGTMALVGKGLASFAKSSATAIKAVNGIKFDKNFATKLVEILGAMTGLAEIGGFTGVLGTIAAPFAVLGNIGFSAITSTITKVAKFASDLNGMEIPSGKSIKPKLKQIQEIATSLTSFKMGKVGNIGAVFSTAFASLSTGNIIGTFKKVSDFVKQISEMPEINTSDLDTKFNALSTFRDSLNKAMKGSSTGGNSVDASFNSFFQKLDTGNIISSFQKVTDFVKKLSSMDTIDAADLDSKFTQIKNVLNEIRDFASEKFDNSLWDSLKSFFGKLDTSNLVSSFTKVADLTKKISALPELGEKALDGKFKSIKSVFDKLKNFKIEAPSDNLSTSMQAVEKIVNPLTQISKKFQSLNGVVVNSTNIIATMSAIKSVIDFLPKLNFTTPKGFDASITNIVKPISSLTSVAKKLQELSGLVVNSVNVIGTMNAIKSIIDGLSTTFVKPIPQGIETTLKSINGPISSITSSAKKLQELSGIVVNSVNVIATINAINSIVSSLSTTFVAPLSGSIGTNLKNMIEPISNLMALAKKLQEMNGVVVNSVNVIATINAIKSIVNSFSSTFAAPLPGNIGTNVKAIIEPISSLMAVANKLQELSGVVVNSTAVIATMNAIMSIVSDGAWITIQSVIANWGGMQAALQNGISAVNSIKNLVAAMNGIPAVSTDIQANVANIQAGLDKLSGLNFSADIAGKAAQFAAAVNTLIGSLKGMGGNFAPVGNEWASKITQGFTAGISASTGTATAAVQSMISAVRNSAAASAGQFQSVGAMIGAGLAAGMYSALGQVRAAADALVSEANRAAQAKAKIHSPSRLFRDEVGWYIGAGVAVGITKSTANVVGATKQLTNKTLNAATSMLPKLQTVSTKMMDAVTPDLSSLSNFAQDSRANFESKLNANYSYNQPIYVTAEVTSNLDGKKVGYGSAQYVKEKNDATETRQKRIGGNI